MEYTKLGNTDLKVSTICLGTWVFGGHCWGEVDDKVSERVVAEAIDKGVNFIDTAPIYGNGRSEEVIGRAIKGRRGGLVIATKCGLKIKGRGLAVDLSAKFIREEVEKSLKRLDIATIDLYQCHWPSDTTPYKETFGELNKLVKEGKVKYLGISNFDKKQTKKAAEYSPIATNQVQYSLLDRRIEEELLPFCEENGISILPYGALGGGILTGKHKEPPKIEKGDVKDFFYKFYEEPQWTKAKEVVSVLGRIAEKHNAPISHVAVNWVLSHKAVDSCIAGCRTPKQVDLNAGAAEWKLGAEDLELIQREYERVFGR